MNNENVQKNNNLKIILLFFISFISIIIISNFDFFTMSNEIANEMISNSLLRLIGGIVFVILMYMIGYKKLISFKRPILNSLLIIIPGIIISINNFPIIAYLDGRADILEPSYTIYIFMIECISTGFFEEIIFRGILLFLLLQKLPSTKKGMYLAIFISSAIFSLSHLINLFGGVNLNDTVLQVGYSFLMGLMWAVIYLKTRNIWMSVILHSTYNFFGLVLFRLGYVNNRYDNVTIITTVLLAILVAIYTLYISLKIDVNKLEELYEI